MRIDGKQLASEILENLKQKLSTFGSDPKVAPTMAVILVGNNPASLSYIKQKQLSAEKIGAKVILKQFPVSISQISLISQISYLNSDTSIHGIIVQRPLPPSLYQSKPNEKSQNKNQSAISNQELANWLDLAVSPEKDIDGFHPESKFLSPVGLAVIHILNYIFNLKSNDQKLMTEEFFKWLNSQKILLLGRGETGGKPIANTMDKLKIKYTQTHSKTKNIKGLLRQADIIISAVGKPNFITGDMIKIGTICIGVGISRLDNEPTTKDQSPKTILVGDFDESTISTKASYFTPVPGGIGPLTVAFLLSNLLKGYSNNN